MWLIHQKKIPCKSKTIQDNNTKIWYTRMETLANGMVKWIYEPTLAIDDMKI